MRRRSSKNNLGTQTYQTSARTLSSKGLSTPAAILKIEHDAIKRLRSNAPVLGIIASTEIEMETTRLESGDSIVMFTDGVTEAHNCRCEQYGTERLQAAILSAPPMSSSDATLKHILTDLVTFTLDAPQSDDITALIISRD